MKHYPNWKPKAVRTLLLYTFDMAVAVAGWTFGFGLHVKNWWALVGLLVLSRFVFHILTQASYFEDAKQRAQDTWVRETGWLVERTLNGQTLYRTMNQGMMVWTPDSLEAMRFARRQDAELFVAEDEDAWFVTQHSWEGPR